MASTFGNVEKIYDFKAIGIPDIEAQLKILTKLLNDVKLAKQELNKEFGKANTDTELDAINKKLAQQTIKEKELTLAIKEQTAQRKALKLAAETEKTGAAAQAFAIPQDNSIKKAREDNKALRAERDLLNTSEAEGTKRIAELNGQIDENNILIEKNVDLLTQRKINVGNYEGSAKIIVEALKSVEQEIAKLQEKQAGLQNLSKNPIGFKLAGGQEQLNQTNAQLGVLNQKLQGLQRITENPRFLNVAGKLGDAQAEVKFFTKALVDLQDQQRNGIGIDPKLIDDIKERLAFLIDDIHDTKTELKALSSDTRTFDLVAGGFKNMADGAQLFIGTQALFGKSNEDVQRSLQQLLAVQNIATAARSIADEATKHGTLLNKAYNAVLAQTKILTDANATSTAKWQAVLKLGVVGAVIAGIIFLISKFDDLNGRQKELANGLNRLAETSDNTKDHLASLGKTVDEVSKGVLRELKDATKALNDELKKTPTVLDDVRAALKLNAQEIDRLSDVTNQFVDKSILQRILDAIPFLNSAAFQAEDVAKKLKAATENQRDLQNQQGKFLQLQAEKAARDSSIAGIDASTRSIELQIDANSRITANEKISFKERLTALKDNFEQRRQVIGNEETKEVALAQGDQLKIKAAEQKGQADRIKNERDFRDQSEALRKEGSEKGFADALSRIEAERAIALANEKIRVAEIQQLRELTLEEEIAFLQNVEKIELAAIDKKIALYKRQKTLDATQLKDLAELRQARAELILKDTQDEQKLRQDAFDRQAALAKKQFEAQVAAIREETVAAQADPTLSEETRATIKAENDQKILDLQIVFNAAMDTLEKQLGANSIKNAKLNAAEITATKKEIADDQRAIIEGRLKDIDTAAEVVRDKIGVDYQKLREVILTNDRLTAEERKRALDKLDLLFQHDQLAIEVKTLALRFEQIHALYNVGLADEKTYFDAKQKLEEAKANLVASENSKDFLTQYVKNLKNAFKVIKEQYKQGLIDEETFLNKKQELEDAKRKLALARADDFGTPSAQNTQSRLQQTLGQAFGFAEGSGEDQLLGNVIAQSFSLAADAMNAYFDAEQQRIQQSLDLTLQRIDVEKQQLTARAQSQAEIESIEKQAEAKKRTAQRAAGEQLKKSKLSEAKIALATELANIAAAAAGNPANPVTFGAAGAIMYAILAALALGRYAINVSSINRATFGKGTLVNRKGVPIRGGKFAGRAHEQGGTPFSFDDFEAEVDELAVIRTRNAPKGKRYTITGTQNEIASAINTVGGGHDFAPGATVEEPKAGVFTIIRNLFTRKARAHVVDIHVDKIETRVVHETTEDMTRRSINQSIVDRVFHEHRSAVDRRESTYLLHRALEITSTEVVTSKRIAELTRLISERFKRDDERRFTITGTTLQIVKTLALPARAAFAFGGLPGEVPLRGGTFGGRSHAQGGTDFSFANREYNAEVKEIAIIRTRNAPKGKRYNLTGTQEQIASALNKIGGGHDFAPGASVRKFAGGGVLSALQAPIFTPSSGNSGASDALLKELQTLGERIDAQAEASLAMAAATNKRVDNLKVSVISHDITNQQNKDAKQAAVGTL